MAGFHSLYFDVGSPEAKLRTTGPCSNDYIYSGAVVGAYCRRDIYVLFLAGCGGGRGGDDGVEGEGAEVERASAVQWAFQFRYS